MPFGTEKIIPKRMIPSTSISAGFSKQRNIGLDKENFTGGLAYNWSPKRYNTAKLELFNAQFVRNLNPNNYFNVYTSSYNELNNIGKDYNVNASEYSTTNENLNIPTGTQDLQMMF